MATTGTQDRVPAACTLPTLEQPLRLAEFDVFFRAAVRRSIRTSTTRLDLVILGEFEATARDLAERETSCCSFFRFDFHPVSDGLVMSIGVPLDHVDVLDALQARIVTVWCEDGPRRCLRADYAAARSPTRAPGLYLR